MKLRMKSKKLEWIIKIRKQNEYIEYKIYRYIDLLNHVNFPVIHLIITKMNMKKVY